MNCLLGSHSELVENPDGAYAQLIRLQEVNKESEQTTSDENKTEVNQESFRQSSQIRSMARSRSWGSSVGNSSRHSFSVSFGLPTAGIHDTILTAPKASPQETKPIPNVSISRLAALNKPEIPVLLIGAVVATINGLLFPIFGVLVSRMIKVFFEPPHKQEKDSKFWAIMFIVLCIASFVIIPTRLYFFSIAGGKLIQRIRLMCFEKIVHMEMGWFDEPEHSSGALGARLSADAAIVPALVGDALGLLVQNISSAVTALLIAFLASWQLAFIIVALLPLLGVNGYIQAKFMKGFSANAKVHSKTDE